MFTTDQLYPVMTVGHPTDVSPLLKRGVAPRPEGMPGADRDEHGCIGSAGYSPARAREFSAPGGGSLRQRKCSLQGKQRFAPTVRRRTNGSRRGWRFPRSDPAFSSGHRHGMVTGRQTRKAAPNRGGASLRQGSDQGCNVPPT